jgi:UDP-N-acetylmuramate-alanine ligase
MIMKPDQPQQLSTDEHNGVDQRRSTHTDKMARLVTKSGTFLKAHTNYIGHGHRDARFIGEREAVVEHLLAVVQPGDIVITLGAGSIWQVGELLVRQLQEKG